LSPSAPSPPPFPFPQSLPSFGPGFKRLLGLARYAREAFDLVWLTNRRLTAWVTGLTMGAGALPAAIAYVGKLVIDGVMNAATSHARPARHAVLVLLAIELVLVALLVAFQRGLSVCDALLRVSLAQRVIELVLNKTLTLQLSDFENPNLYDALRQVRDQATERPLSLVRRALTGLQLSIGLLGFLAILAAFSPWIVIALLAAALPAVLAEARFNTDAFRLFRRHTPEARLQSYFETVLTRDDHAKEVLSFGLGPLLLNRHRAIFRNLYSADSTLTMRRGAWGFGLALLAALALAASYAWVVLQAMAGLISIGALAMLFAVLRQAQNTTTELLLVIAGMYDDNLYLSTLHEFLAHGSAPVCGVAESGPNPSDGLRFEQVEFSYPGAAQPALQAIDLHLAPGRKLAIAGRNGAGKSTLIKLALGLYAPSRGRVLLDGRDLREWNRAALARRFGVLFQDFARYQLSVRDNIGFGAVENLGDAASSERAARLAGVHELIERLPQGYRTQLGHWFEGGHELSVGEWQKVALARALMRGSADIVVMDEPSASLDAAAEEELTGRLWEFSKNKSVLLISHRLATVRGVDQILMLDAGRCVEQGRHEELLAKSGPYAALFVSQTGVQH
jgi:ATP-binding cassette subfamily B protein